MPRLFSFQRTDTLRLLHENWMQRLTREAFDIMRSDATVLERDGFGEKVLALKDGTFLKLFRRKSWLSKNLFVSPAQRFARNAESLAIRGIPSPAVIRLYYLRFPYRSVIHYRPLPGQTLREIVSECASEMQLEAMEKLPDFVRNLHDAGVYFRSLHFGNIVYTPQRQFGLIDISDMSCSRRPLSRNKRRRNIKHLLRTKSDWSMLPLDVAQRTIKELLTH